MPDVVHYPNTDAQDPEMRGFVGSITGDGKSAELEKGEER